MCVFYFFFTFCTHVGIVGKKALWLILFYFILSTEKEGPLSKKVINIWGITDDAQKFIDQ